MMEDIRKQALEAAREHAHDFDDLITKAAKLEAFLLGEPVTSSIPAYRDVVIHNPNSEELSDSAPEIDDDAAAAIITNAKALTSDMTDLGFVAVAPEKIRLANAEKQMIEDAKVKMAEAAAMVERADILSGEPVPEILPDTLMKNWHENGSALRPVQLLWGDYCERENVIFVMSRNIGTTTMLAAFARQQAAVPSKVLFLTSNHGLVKTAEDLIGDASVTVMSFAGAAGRTHAGETYDCVIIDSAANIPYGIQHDIIDYIHMCQSSKLIMASTPGEERGWFYEQYTKNNLNRRLMFNWQFGEMSQGEAERIKAKIGADAFENQYNCKFRPVEWNL